MTQTLIEEVKETAIDYLKDNECNDTYGCDLHNEIFNTDYFCCYTSDCKKYLEQYGVFEAIEKVKDYFTDKPSEDGWTYPKSNSWGTGGWQQRHKGDSTQTRNLYSNKGWRNPDGSYAKPEEKK